MGGFLDNWSKTKRAEERKVAYKQFQFYLGEMMKGTETEVATTKYAKKQADTYSPGYTNFPKGRKGIDNETGKLFILKDDGTKEWLE